MERVLIIVLISLFVVSLVEAENYVTCFNKRSPCFTKKIPCPNQCPSTVPNATSPKVCHLNCLSPVCAAECRNRKPNCNGPGSACLDPRFIGGDGIVFYFHGKRDEHYALVSDQNLQINARFIGLRPQGRTRDFTWIQALGILFFGSKNFTLEAKRASTWDEDTDLLKLSFSGQEIFLPETLSSSWECEETGFRVERTSSKNSVSISIPGEVVISVNVVPITKEDDRVHSYRIPVDDCFAHLEVQFRFLGLSSQVEGVLGRTYSPDFENPTKPGVAMPIMGGEDKYWTPSLLSANCGFCKFSNDYKSLDEEEKVGGVLGKGFEFLDCRRNGVGGNGLVCKK